METPQELRKRAARYRAIIMLTTDPDLIEALRTLAKEYDEIAARFEEDQASIGSADGQSLSRKSDGG
jgi:hypothetical protein